MFLPQKIIINNEDRRRLLEVMGMFTTLIVIIAMCTYLQTHQVVCKHFVCQSYLIKWFKKERQQCSRHNTGSELKLELVLNLSSHLS